MGAMDTDVQDAPPQTGGDEPVLAPEHRKKLDSIVMQLAAQNAPREDVVAIVEDFKKKYATKAAPNQAPPAKPLPTVIKSIAPTPTATDSHVKPLMPGNAPTPAEFGQLPSVEQKHNEQVALAHENIRNTMSDIHKTAVNVLNHQKLLEQKKQQQDYGAAMMDGQNAKEPIPQLYTGPTKEQVDQMVANPAAHPTLLAAKANELEAEGKKAEADKLKADTYALQSGQRAGNREQQLKNIELVKKGELDYDPKKQQLIKKVSGIEGAVEAGKQNVQFTVGAFDLLHANDKKKAEILNKELGAHNPDEPVTHIEGMANFVGGQLPLLATGMVPIAGEGLVTVQMAAQGYRSGMENGYVQAKTQLLKEKHPDLTGEEIQGLLSQPDPEIDKQAVQKATVIANEHGAIDGLTGYLMSKMGGKELQPHEIKPFSISAQEAIKAAAGTVKTAGLFGAGQAAKNLALEHQGMKTEDGSVAEAGLNGAFLHAGFFLLGKAGKALSAGAKTLITHNIAEQPIEQVKQTAQNLVDHGLIEPDKAKEVVADVEKHQEFNNQIPGSVKNQDARIDIIKDLKRRVDMKDQLDQLGETFKPIQKEKIAALDEKILAKANSPEAKKSPEKADADAADVEEKAVPPETGNRETAADATEPAATASEDSIRKNIATTPEDSNQIASGQQVAIKEQPLETRNRKIVYEKGQRVAYDSRGNEIPQFVTRAKEGGAPGEMSTVQNRNWKRAMDAHAESYNYNFGEKAPEATQPFNDSGEAAKHFIDTSNNPAEIAEAYQMHEKQPMAMDSKEHAIANGIIGKVKPSSFDEFNDSNNRNNAVAKRYFGSEKEGRTLDNIAQEISDQSGVEVSPEDVSHYMLKFANVDDPLKPQDTEIHQAAKEKFEKLTGIPLTDKVAKIATDQLNGKETPVEHSNDHYEVLSDDFDQHMAADKLPSGNKTASTADDYLKKGATILQQLFPDHKLVVHETEAEYTDKEKRPVGSAGVFHPDTKTIALNLERIKASGDATTIAHEVIHPIVKEALESKPEGINNAYSKLVELKDQPGMDAIWKHEDLYRDRGINTVKVEAITEFLTQVADGKIDPSKLSKDLSTKIIEVINQILKALGVEKQFSTAGDLKKLADSIKQAFDTADAKPIADALGKTTGDHASESMDAMRPIDKVSSWAAKQLAAGKDEADIKAVLIDKLNITDGEAQRIIDRINDKNTEDRKIGAEEIIKQAMAIGEQTRAQAKGNPIAFPEKSTFRKTMSRWFYDTQDEVSDVKSIIRNRKGEEEQAITQAYKASNDMRDMWNTVPKVKQLAFILSMERPDLLKTQPDNVKAMADVYRQRLDNVYKMIESSMPNINFIEDYFPHFWKKPDQATAVFAKTLAKNPLEGSKSFAKQRFLQTIEEGLKAGLEMATTNPEEMVRLAEANAWKFKSARNIFDDMNKQGYLKYSTAADLPKEWKGVDDKLFNRMGAYVTKDGDAKLTQGRYMMPPEVANLMNNYLSVGIKGPVKDVIAGFNNVKNNFQLGFGLFHFSTTSVESLINGTTVGLQKLSSGHVLSGAKDLLSTATIIPNLVQSFRTGHKAIVDYHKGNLTDDVQNLINANAKVGLQKMYSLDSWYNTKKAFGELRANKDFSKIPKILWNGLITIPEAMNKPLMEHWVPALKVGGYLRSLQSEITSRPNMTPRELQQAKEKIWDSMDDRLGQVVYDNVFVNKAAKDLAFMAIRSAGWTGGTIRTAVKGVGEIPLSAKRLIKGQGLSQRTADLIAMPLTVGFFGAAIGYVMTGKPPETLEDYFFPKDGTMNPDGTEHRIVLPSYVKDYLAYSKQPAKTLMHKTSPFLNDIVELYQNKDFYGEKVYNEDDPIFQKGLDVLKQQGESMIPFSLKDNKNAATPTGQQKAEQFFGLMGAPKERERSPLQNRIVQAYSKQIGSSEEGKTHDQIEQSMAKRRIREQLFAGASWDDISDDLKDKAKISDKAKTEFINESKISPFERYFKNLSAETKLNLYDSMTDDEQEQYKKYLPEEKKK